MRKTILALLPIVALISSPASAQFTHIAKDGTILSTARKPSGFAYQYGGDGVLIEVGGKLVPGQEFYPSFEADHVRLDVLARLSDGTSSSVTRYFFYYEDYPVDDLIYEVTEEDDTYKGRPDLTQYRLSIESIGGVPSLAYNTDELVSFPYKKLDVVFFTKESRAAFKAELIRRRDEVLSGKKPRATNRVALKEFARPYAAPRPATPQPKARTSITVTLVNEGKVGVSLVLLDSPSASSSSNRYLAPGASVIVQTKVGGQVRTKNGYVLLTFTDAMHQQKVVVAR